MILTPDWGTFSLMTAVVLLIFTAEWFHGYHGRKRKSNVIKMKHGRLLRMQWGKKRKE